MTDRLYTVDPPDRHEAATATVLAQAYKYDANGRRVEKAVSGGIIERYVYSGVETIATYNGSNTWKQDFVFGQGIDEVVMLSQADVLDYDSDQNTSETTRSFYHRNALGSVMDVTDMNQARVESYRYTPYGETTITRGGNAQTSDPLGQHWGFTARFHDEESGLTYYRARTVSAADGRFLERDPLHYSAGANLYTYADDNPLNRRDPTGEMGEGIPPPGGFGHGGCGPWIGWRRGLLTIALAEPERHCVCTIYCYWTHHVHEHTKAWTEEGHERGTVRTSTPCESDAQCIRPCRDAANAIMDSNNGSLSERGHVQNAKFNIGDTPVDITDLDLGSLICYPVRGTSQCR